MQEFQADLMGNILALHADLKNKTYRHGGYYHFRIADPKPRDIHKASVRDRLLHHALYRQLYPFFDCTFIHDSYSCRVGKGTHKAMNRFRSLTFQTSKNHTRTCWVLKCDIRKFFASIDREILLRILSGYIADTNTLWLLTEVIGSFPKGLPLGNLTSQLLVNIYMNKFNQFVKHTLKAECYVRYADDFVILSHDRRYLENLLTHMTTKLEELKLELHPDKVFIKTIASGIDFLGWVHFPDHRVLRTTTRRKMMRRMEERGRNEATKQSYLGMLKHGNAKKLKTKLYRAESGWEDLDSEVS